SSAGGRRSLRTTAIRRQRTRWLDAPRIARSDIGMIARVSGTDGISHANVPTGTLDGSGRRTQAEGFVRAASALSPRPVGFVRAPFAGAPALLDRLRAPFLVAGGLDSFVRAPSIWWPAGFVASFARFCFGPPIRQTAILTGLACCNSSPS